MAVGLRAERQRRNYEGSGKRRLPSKGTANGRSEEQGSVVGSQREGENSKR